MVLAKACWRGRQGNVKIWGSSEYSFQFNWRIGSMKWKSSLGIRMAFSSLGNDEEDGWQREGSWIRRSFRFLMLVMAPGWKVTEKWPEYRFQILQQPLPQVLEIHRDCSLPVHPLHPKWSFPRLQHGLLHEELHRLISSGLQASVRVPLDSGWGPSMPLLPAPVVKKGKPVRKNWREGFAPSSAAQLLLPPPSCSGVCLSPAGDTLPPDRAGRLAEDALPRY